MLQGRETDESYPSTAEVKNGCSNNYIPPVCRRGTQWDINFFTALFVVDHDLFYLYADVDITEAVTLTLIRWTKLQQLLHR
jgi:hypothetical protein